MVGDAYLDFEVGTPDSQGLAFLNVVDSPDYIFVDASSFAPLVLCLKPMLPVTTAGVVDCGGTLDFSIISSTDHNIGQLGVDGFTPEACTAAEGTLEGPNQICAAGKVGEVCFSNDECDLVSEPGAGICGLAMTTCTDGNPGAPCRNDSECGSTPEAQDGACGTLAPEGHEGVCNGPIMIGQPGNETNRPGEVIIAPVQALGLQGLPVELTLEDATPCGDEGPGLMQAFAMTTGLSRTTVLNFNNSEDDFTFDQRGLNFTCSDWQNSPGKFVLSFAVLHQFQSSDVITGFEFGSSVPTPTRTPVP